MRYHDRSGLDWDEKTGRIYGVGVANAGKQNEPHYRELAYYDPSTNEWGTVENSAMQANLTMPVKILQRTFPDWAPAFHAAVAWIFIPAHCFSVP